MATLDIRDLEKVELHCHLDGLLNPELLKQVNARQPVIPLPVEELAQVCPVTSFRQWTRQYIPLMDQYLANRGELLLEVFTAFIKQLKQQFVIYTEIMFDAFQLQYESLEQQMELYRRYRERADELEDGKIQIEFLFALNRTKHPAEMEKKARRLLRAQEEGLFGGVALCGWETESPVKPYTELLQQFKQAGFGIEIHAGEWAGPGSVWDALEYGCADRIGHGLAVFDDPVLVKHVQEHDIHLEMCPTSNLILAEVQSIQKHPIKQAIDQGLNHSINTNYPGPLACTLNSEYALVAQTFGMGEEYFAQVQANSLRSRFVKQLRYRT
jgi:adenosine deaminase